MPAVVVGGVVAVMNARSHRELMRAGYDMCPAPAIDVRGCSTPTSVGDADALRKGRADLVPAIGRGNYFAAGAITRTSLRPEHVGLEAGATRANALAAAHC